LERDLMSDAVSDVGFLYDISIELVVELGRTRLTVRELAELSADDIVHLDRVAGQPLDMMVGGKLFGRGEVVLLEDRVGLRIVELAGRAEEGES